MTAYHEVGHALMCVLLEHAHPLHKVSIIPRGFALGLTMFFPEEDILTQTRSQLVDQIGVSLGGRVAEEVIYGEITTGAHDDLEKATKLARRMMTEFGMSERLGPMTFGKRHEQVFLGRDFGHERDYGEQVASIIDEEIKGLIDNQYARVKALIEKYRPHMDAIVAVLLEKETLDRKDVDAIIEEISRKLGWITEDKTQGTDGGGTPPTAAVKVDESHPLQSSSSKNPDSPDSKPGLKPKFA